MNEIEIVLVELGRMPNYTILNLERLNILFPQIPLTLITDVPKRVDHLTEYVKIVEWETKTLGALEGLKIYRETKNKFWLHTTSRLFALCDYHSKTDSRTLLHLESDVILGSNFPFEKFTESKTLLWGKYNAERDVASLLFSPSRTLSNLLKVTMQKELIRDAGHTDMSLLSKVAIELDKQHAYLPSLSSKTSKLLNRRSKPSDEEIIQNSELSPYFGGVFDHAVIGMWIDGLDPQHKFGFRENLFGESVMSGESYVDPISVEYHLQRPFELAITEEQALTPLYCLHIHSKSTLWFRLDEIEIIKNKVELANAKERSISLDLKVLIELIVHNFQNGTLIQWARHGLKYLIDLRRKKGKST